MPRCKLVIRDNVNCRFENVDARLRKQISDTLKFMVPHARHTPAYKLGRWDGKVAFCTPGGATFINLLDRVVPLLLDAQYEIEIDDQRPELGFAFAPVTDEVLADRVWPPGHQNAGEPIMLRDHQVEAINRYLDNLQSLQSIATAAGKTILCSVLSMLVEPYGRSLVIVPSKSLVEQTAEDYRNVGLDTGLYYGDLKQSDRQHTICTWQSLSVFAKNSKKGQPDISLEAFLKGVVCVIVDECHSIRGTELKDLLCGPMAQVPIRWGLSGTIPKEDFEFMALLASVGPVVGEVRAADLQDKGILANCHIEVLQLNDSHVEYPSYDEERDYLMGDRDRLRWLVDFAQRTSEGGNTLVLVDRIETGRFLEASIPGAVFVSGEMKTKDRKREYKEVQTADAKLIIATYGVAAVGVNIPRLFNLVLFEAGKSPIRVIQSIGRVLRISGDKDFANIYDVCSSLKFSKRHMSKRTSYYRDLGYPYAVKKISY